MCREEATVVHEREIIRAEQIENQGCQDWELEPRVVVILLKIFRAMDAIPPITLTGALEREAVAG